MNTFLMRLGLITTLLAAIFFSSLLRAANLIQSVTTTNNTIRIVAEKQFTDTYLTSNFFAEYDKSINLEKLDSTILTIPFIMNAAPIIWISQKTYSIDAMDEDLYNSLAIIKKIFQAFYPGTVWSGQLVPKKLVKNHLKKPSSMTAVMFSHGLDAVYTSLHNRHLNQLLITVCGGDVGLHQATMWNNVKQQCLNFGQNHGHRNAFVRSNFNIFRNFSYLIRLTNGEIGNWFGQTSQSLGYTGLAAPIAYAKGCAKILLASTRTSDNPFPYGTHPVIDNSIAFAGITVEHDGPEVNRLEKIREIAALCQQHSLEKPVLRVCWGNDPLGGNCNKCEKCFRTIVELLVERQIPNEYGFAIDTNTAINNARTQAPGKKKLDAGLMWHWNCIQQEARKVLAEGTPLGNPALAEFISWMALLDLTTFKKSNGRQRTKQEKEIFSLLWKKATQHTFTAQDLELLATIERSKPAGQ